jgi:hypothetical protein
MRSDEEYRLQAAECRRMAENARRPLDKDAWLRLAEQARLPTSFLRVKRTAQLRAQTSDFDPTRTLGSLVLAELFVPRPGQYEVFWMGVGSCRLVKSCSSRRDVPTSPFEANGQRGMPSAGIALSINRQSFCAGLSPSTRRAYGHAKCLLDRDEGGR